MRYAIFKNQYQGSSPGRTVLNCEIYDTYDDCVDAATDYLINKHPQLSDEMLENLDAGDYTLEIWSNQECVQIEELDTTLKYDALEPVRYFDVRDGEPVFVTTNYSI